MLVDRPCPTLCDPMDRSPPGSSVPGILQARTLEWVAMPSSRGVFATQGWNPGLLHCRRILYQLSRQGSPQEDDVCDAVCCDRLGGEKKRK